MEYTFSWGAFLLGILILAASGSLVIYYRPIADNFGSGAASYDRYRIWGLVGCGIGFIVMLNLHTFFLTLLYSQFFGAK
jgi:hypothetical protein